MKTQNSTISIRPKIRHMTRYELQQLFSKKRKSSRISPSMSSIPIHISTNQESFSFESKGQLKQVTKFKKTKIKFCHLCLTVTGIISMILIATLITSITLLTIKTTTTTTTQTTATTTTSTTSTSTTSTSTTSSSSTSSSTSTTSSTSSTTSSTTSTSVTSTTSTATTSTSVTTTSSSTSTTQNPTLASFDHNAAGTGSWKYRSYAYYATKTGSVTLKFTFMTSANYIWYLDDVSVRDLSSIEKLTNSDFEASPSLTGWSTGSTISCSSSSGISTSKSHSSSKSFYNSCDIVSNWIYQSFTVTNGESYNVSFWFYLDKVASWLLIETIDVVVTVT